MQHLKLTLALFLALAAVFGTRADAEEEETEEVAAPAMTAPAAPKAPVAKQAPAAPAPVAQAAEPSMARPIVGQSFRTFMTIQRYTLENNGDPASAISNVRLEMKFPGDVQIKLPGGEQHWPIGNGQVQEVNQTFEIPWAYVKGDSFSFVLQMVRKGAQILPCQFDVKELSQFNRSYTCQTDVNWQVNNKVPEKNIAREGVQIRVFTDRNTPSKEIPKDAVALK